VRSFIGADTLAYLSLPGLMRAVGRGASDQFCRACFDGSYPVPVPQQLEMDKMAFEQPASSPPLAGEVGGGPAWLQAETHVEEPRPRDVMTQGDLLEPLPS
jgi:hypothetical protein